MVSRYFDIFGIEHPLFDTFDTFDTYDTFDISTSSPFDNVDMRRRIIVVDDVVVYGNYDFAAYLDLDVVVKKII